MSTKVSPVILPAMGETSSTRPALSANDDNTDSAPATLSPNPAPVRGDTLADVVERAWQTFARGGNIPTMARMYIDAIRRAA